MSTLLSTVPEGKPLFLSNRELVSLKLRFARAAGVRISLGTDSHGPSQLRFMELAAGATLIAGIPKNRILNCIKKDELLGWADNVRSRVHTRPTKSKRTP